MTDKLTIEEEKTLFLIAEDDFYFIQEFMRKKDPATFNHCDFEFLRYELMKVQRYIGAFRTSYINNQRPANY